MNTYRLGLVTLGTLCALAMPAAAQSNPSVDQIINQLKPGASALHGPTRGIHPLGPTAAVAPAEPAPAASKPKASGVTTASAGVSAVPSAPSEPAATAEAPSIDLYVLFNTGSADLTPAAVATLDKLGTALSSSTLAAYRFRIEGHTDTVGSETYNLALSRQRAEAVAGYLEQKYGLTAARLEVVGVGQGDLLVATPPQTAEPRNRRVKVVNLGA
jgi:outer membrane protein OmpA-like peptidoglycan-associated protein